MSHRAEIDRLLRSWPSDWKRQWTNARAQLRRLEYDAPAHPDASDALMALYLTAGGRESGDPIKGSIPVPAAVRDEAMRAVRMAHRFNYGAWNFIGLARAIQLATIPRIDTRSVERMRGFFTRHAKDARAPGFGNDERPSRGYLAHLVWGGDPAKEWVMGMEKRVRRNPLAQPSATLAFSVRKGVVPGVVEVYLYEPADIDDTERSMVAGMMASFNGRRWEASGVAACPGYGPLIYDLTATLLKERLHATRDRSEAAKKFWARQGKKYIEPMTPEDFRAKYGVSVDDIYRRGLVLTPEDLRRMSDHLVSVFFGAKEAEKEGKPKALLRCAVPNGRARRNEGAPTLRDLAFQPIPNIPDSKRVSLDFKNGHYLTIAGAPSFPDQGDGTSTWAAQVTEGSRTYNLQQQTREQVEALIAQLAAKPATDDYLKKHDYPAYQARVKARQAEAESKRKDAEDAAYKRLMTPKFRKWFGKSKVVDTQGRPLKVYHGSRNAGFHAFDTSEQEKPGFFFTNDLSMARSYTPKSTNVELPYFRTLKEALAFEETPEFPLTIEKKEGGYDVYFDGSYLGFYGKGETKDMLAEINGQSARYPGVYEVYLRIEDPMVVDAKGANWDAITFTDDDGYTETMTTNDISRMAEDMGYDGVIIRDVSDAGGHGHGGESGDVYIVFNPNQIKSTQNIGTYSRDTDDLRLNPRKERQPRKPRSPRRRR